MQLGDYIQLQLFFGAAKSFCSSSQRNFVMELEKRGLSKVLSNDGLDIRQDVDAARQASDFVKLDDHNKKMAALDNALRARMCRSFIAGAVFGVLILVAIILAIVSLQKIDNTTTDFGDKTGNTSTLVSLMKTQIEALEQKLDTTSLQLDALKVSLSRRIDDKLSASEFTKDTLFSKLENKLCNGRRINLPHTCV